MKLSIILTSYNYSQYIGEAIESVLEQDFQDWELLIIDDGSSDNSLDIINKYLAKDSRIKLFQHPNGENKGLASSVKLGLKNASHDWIVFLESDDKLNQYSLSKRLEIIDKYPEVDLIFSDFIPFQDENLAKDRLNYLENLKKIGFDCKKSGFVKNAKKMIIKSNFIMTFSIVMIRKNLLLNCDFNTPCKALLDHYLWAQCSNKNIYYLTEKLTSWRMHANSYINKSNYSWLYNTVFFTKIYLHTLKDKNIILKTLLVLNFIRTRFIYIKINRSYFKINLLYGIFVYEKKLKP